MIEGVGMWGEIVDLGRGQSAAALQDPSGVELASDLARIARISTLTIAMQCGALDNVCRNLLTEVNPAVHLSFSTHSLLAVLNAIGAIFLNALISAMPLVIICIIIDFITGLISRLSTLCGTPLPGFIVKTGITYGYLYLLVQNVIDQPSSWILSVLDRMVLL